MAVGGKEINIKSNFKKQLQFQDIFCKETDVQIKTDKIILLEELVIPAPPDFFLTAVCNAETQKNLEINFQLFYQPTLLYIHLPRQNQHLENSFHQTISRSEEPAHTLYEIIHYIHLDKVFTMSLTI